MPGPATLCCRQGDGQKDDQSRLPRAGTEHDDERVTFGPFYACVNFYGRSGCNYWTYVPVGQWRNLATNVKDGTKFYIWLRIDMGKYYGFRAVGDW